MWNIPLQKRGMIGIEDLKKHPTLRRVSTYFLIALTAPLNPLKGT
jgi:hypothetical protein